MKPFEQQIFDGIIRLFQKEGITTYPELPLKEVPYPFVVVSEVQIVPKATSSTLLGTVHVRLDIWGDRKQRVNVSSIVTRSYHIARLVPTEGKRLTLNTNASNGRILSDTSTQSVLWHGIVDLEYQIII